MQKVKYFGILLLSSLPLLTIAASVKGKLNCSDEWKRIAYLSVIQSFDDLHTASYDFLRYQVNIDSSGYFEFRDLDLAKTDRIYRLHICKKGDPVSTIIIGGQEENFIHFLMNNYTDIEIVQETGAKGLRLCSARGHPKGDELEALFGLQTILNTPPELPSEQNRKFRKQQVLQGLREIADTSSNVVTKLLAVHIINENFAGAGHFSLMATIDKELTPQERSGTYYRAFSEQLNYLQFQSDLSKNRFYPWLALFFLALFAGLFFWIKNRRPVAADQAQHQMIQALTRQEKRVFNLLKEGKSNKEISSELHIEVSTVKSHLNRIYSRLGLRSRKDIVGRE